MMKPKPRFKVGDIAYDTAYSESGEDIDLVACKITGVTYSSVYSSYVYNTSRIEEYPFNCEVSSASKSFEGALRTKAEASSWYINNIAKYESELKRFKERLANL